MSRIRLALTLPGAVSLGAFEAGAVAALLTAVQHINKADPEAVRIDVVTAASSGSLTGLLAVRVLLAGKDPVPAFHRAWVTDASLHRVWGRRLHAPLSLCRIRLRARALLELRDADDLGCPQGTGITLEMALGNLRGFSYEIARPGRSPRLGRPPLYATSHLDWGSFKFKPPGDADLAEAALDVALASASHPAAFPAARLDRTALRGEYVRNRIVNLPPEDPLALWYVDGGVLENEPLGRCLDLVRQADVAGGETRLVLVVRPEPDAPPAVGDPAWTGRGVRPRWTEALIRALRMFVTQSLYEDLRRVEKTNSRIRWTNEVADTLAKLLAAAPQAREQLEGVLTGIQSEKRQLHRHTERAPRPVDGEPLAELVKRLLGAATGLEEKLEVGVEVVTAQASAGGAGVPPLPPRLAGSFLARFGGFLDERFREHDFAVGYRSAIAWMADRERGLVGYGLSTSLVAPAVAAAAEHGPGEAKPASNHLPLGTRLRVARLGLRAVVIGFLDARALRRRAGKA
jgi:predicted acylesterase/phospholipase RssA